MDAQEGLGGDLTVKFRHRFMDGGRLLRTLKRWLLDFDIGAITRIRVEDIHERDGLSVTEGLIFGEIAEVAQEAVWTRDLH